MRVVGGVFVGLSLAWLIGSATVVANSPSVEFDSDVGKVILWPFLSSLSLGCGLLGGSY